MDCKLEDMIGMLAGMGSASGIPSSFPPPCVSTIYFKKHLEQSFMNDCWMSDHSMIRDGCVIWWQAMQEHNCCVRTDYPVHRSKICSQMMVFIQDHDHITVVASKKPRSSTGFRLSTII